MTTEVQVRDHFLTLDGLRVHYRDWGDAAAQPPTLVLLHGAMGHTRRWDRVAAALADRFRVLALDWRGHGESAWADDYTHPRMEEDLHAFLEHLALRRVAVVGESMGGIIAYLYTARHPGAVARLVIGDVGPDGVRIAATPQARAGLRAAAAERFTDPEDAITKAVAATPRQPADDVRHQTRANLVQRDDGTWGWRYDGARLASWFDSVPPEAEQWQLLAQISCPTLVVRGAESHLLSPATAERMVQTIPHGQVVELPDSGHRLVEENPAGFVAVVRPFLLGESG
jgi:pimeloyl-ACP methyl ester carboxylesterase